MTKFYSFFRHYINIEQTTHIIAATKSHFPIVFVFLTASGLLRSVFLVSGPGAAIIRAPVINNTVCISTIVFSPFCTEKSTLWLFQAYRVDFLF